MYINTDFCPKHLARVCKSVHWFHRWGTSQKVTRRTFVCSSLVWQRLKDILPPTPHKLTEFNRNAMITLLAPRCHGNRQLHHGSTEIEDVSSKSISKWKACAQTGGISSKIWHHQNGQSFLPVLSSGCVFCDLFVVAWNPICQRISRHFVFGWLGTTIEYRVMIVATCYG